MKAFSSTDSPAVFRCRVGRREEQDFFFLERKLRRQFIHYLNQCMCLDFTSGAVLSLLSLQNSQQLHSSVLWSTPLTALVWSCTLPFAPMEVSSTCWASCLEVCEAERTSLPVEGGLWKKQELVTAFFLISLETLRRNNILFACSSFQSLPSQWESLKSHIFPEKQMEEGRQATPPQHQNNDP